MALADIDTILIQASYTQQPAESRYLGQGRTTEGLGLAGSRVGRSTARRRPYHLQPLWPHLQNGDYNSASITGLVLGSLEAKPKMGTVVHTAYKGEPELGGGMQEG